MATKKITTPKVTAPKTIKKSVTKPVTDETKKVEAKPNEFAIVTIGAHQYQVKVGDKVSVEKLNLKPGEKYICEQVLLYTDGTISSFGTPNLSGSKVVFEYVEDTRGEKLRVAHFRNKSRYRKVRGHRQDLSLLKVLEITNK